MIILGIDPSLNSLGYAILDCNNAKISLLTKGTIKAASSKACDYHEKLVKIHTEISNITTLYKPNIFAIEDTFVNKNPSTSLKLGVVRGICISIAIANRTKLEEYSPTRIKKTITGKGSGEKTQLMYILNTILPNHNAQNSDESDAISIAITSFLHQNNHFQL